MTEEQIRHFETLGFFLWKQLLSPDEMRVLSDAFDVAMRKARDGEEDPELRQDEGGNSARRQQTIPFFDYDPEAFYPLLDDERFVNVLEALLGDDFILTLSEGVIHAGGTRWHHDACGPEGFFSMKVAIYLDPLGPDDGCLSVIPGSHFKEYRDALRETIGSVGVKPEEITGHYRICTKPGDVIFMNHKTHHAALSDNPGRRVIYFNAVQNTTAEKNQEHFDWLMDFLRGETNHWGRFYSENLLHTATPRQQKMMDRAIELGFGNTGPISHLQSL